MNRCKNALQTLLHIYLWSINRALSAALRALPAAKDALVVGNMESIKEQPRALRHAPLTNMQKSLLHIFVTVYFVRSFFFDYLFLSLFFLCTCICLFPENDHVIKSAKKCCVRERLSTKRCTNYGAINIQKLLHIYFCKKFFCRNIFVHLIKMTI